LQTGKVSRQAIKGSQSVGADNLVGYSGESGVRGVIQAIMWRHYVQTMRGNRFEDKPWYDTS
jgi:hypothetical protein